MLPPLVPFGTHAYHEVMPILDWDHRLPSRSLVLRIYAYYDARLGRRRPGVPIRAARPRHRATRPLPRVRRARLRRPARRRGLRVPVDLSGEARAAAADQRLAAAHGRRPGAHAASTWSARLPQFKSAAAPAAARPGLGDLEPVGWCPPCESDYADWTLDVWYLTDFDGSVGRGHSFLVDPEQHKVSPCAEFMVRASEAP